MARPLHRHLQYLVSQPTSSQVGVYGQVRYGVKRILWTAPRDTNQPDGVLLHLSDKLNPIGLVQDVVQPFLVYWSKFLVEPGVLKPIRNPSPIATPDRPHVHFGVYGPSLHSPTFKRNLIRLERSGSPFSDSLQHGVGGRRSLNCRALAAVRCIVTVLACPLVARPAIVHQNETVLG